MDRYSFNAGDLHPIRVNLTWHGLIFSLARRFAEVALEIPGGGREFAKLEAGRDGGDYQVVNDLECAPEARIYSPAERGETPISQSSESVTSATRRWQ